jgi:hypothetical protein
MKIDPKVISGTMNPDMLEILDQYKYVIHVPMEEEWEAEQPYEHLRRGRCMTCGAVLGEDTVMMLNGQGVLGLWHLPECLADIHAISFLQQVEAGIVERIEERGVEDE